MSQNRKKRTLAVKEPGEGSQQQRTEEGLKLRGEGGAAK